METSRFVIYEELIEAVEEYENPNTKRETLYEVKLFRRIGLFLDDVIWLQVPESISFSLSYLNLSNLLRIKEQ